jgi:hypothetical protein
MRTRPTPSDPSVKTRLQCDVTEGYNVKPGARLYEWCPFCGHRISDGDSHEITLDFRG